MKDRHGLKKFQLTAFGFDQIFKMLIMSIDRKGNRRKSTRFCLLLHLHGLGGKNGGTVLPKTYTN